MPQITVLYGTIDIPSTLQYNGLEENAHAWWLITTIEAKARGVADSGTHSGYTGLSAHLAGEPVVLGLKCVQIQAVVGGIV